MSHNPHLSGLFEGGKHPKIVLLVSTILLLVLELTIYATLAGQSGLKSRIAVTDANGTKIYESSGSALSAYEKMTFESNFGPLRNYSTHVETEEVPFPFRTWILLAIGLPLGLILLLAFLVQVWLLLLNGNPGENVASRSTAQGKTRFDTFLSASRNFSVLHVGFVIVLAMLILWLIPSFLGDLARSCLGAVGRYPWFFLGLTGFAAGLLTWVIYLRYRLSKQMLENQLEIEKYRIQTNLLAQSPVQNLIGSGREDDATAQSQILNIRES